MSALVQSFAPDRVGAPPADLDAVLAGWPCRAAPGPPLKDLTARVRLDAGGAGAWTLEVRRGAVRVRRGILPAPTTTVRADGPLLAAVVEGRESGLGAFLDGRLVVRGDLAVALQLDGLFRADDRPNRFPRAAVAHPLGIRTVYLEAGPPDAPPLILLHGLGATNASMLPTLWDLAPAFRVIAPDLPGFGASAAPRGPYTPAWFACWLAAFQNEIDARPAALLGNSLVGRIALEAGLERPELVRRLVLLCPSPAFRALRQLAPVVRLVRPAVARLPMVVSQPMVVESLRSMFSVPERLPQPWYDAAADEFLRVFTRPAHRVAFVATMRQIYLEQAYGERGFWTRLPGLRPPALFVWGDRDRLVPAAFARHVERAVPTAGSIVLEDCGHVPQCEHRDLTGALVRTFLSA